MIFTIKADTPDYPQDPDELNDAHPWDLRDNLSTPWDTGDESDASEPSDDRDYITFTGQSAPSPRELELEFRQFDLSEPNAFVLDFPEDVGESVECDTVLASSDSGVIGRRRRRWLTPVSRVPDELSVEAPDHSPGYAPTILISRMREITECDDEEKSFPHTPSPGLDHLDVADGVPINVPMSPLILPADGFPDDTAHPYSDLVGAEASEMPADADWLEGSLGEIIYGPCLEEDFMEFDRNWHGQRAEELDQRQRFL